MGIVGCNFRTEEGVVDHVTWQFGFLFSILLRLVNREDIFNYGFWKICLKITNDLEPGHDQQPSDQPRLIPVSVNDRSIKPLSSPICWNNNIKRGMGHGICK